MRSVSVGGRKAPGLSKKTDLYNLVSRLTILPSLPAQIPHLSVLRVIDSFGLHEMPINVGREIPPYQLDAADCRDALLRYVLLLVEHRNIAP